MKELLQQLQRSRHLFVVCYPWANGTGESVIRELI